MGFLDKLERKYGKYAIHNLPAIIIGTYIAGYIIALLMPGVFATLTWNRSWFCMARFGGW